MRWFGLGERFGSEADLVDAVLKALSGYFLIEIEVGGTHCCSGQRLKLDAVLRPVNRSGWHDPDPCFGVEFKNVREAGGIRGFTKWAAQAVDYAHTTWDEQ